MTSHQILRNGPFDATIHPDAGIDDLDKEKTGWFVGLAREKRQFPLQYSEANTGQILLSLHLITDDDRIKNAALLLFAKDVQKWFTSASILNSIKMKILGLFYGDQKCKKEVK